MINRRRKYSFTLIELLVAMSVLVIIVVLLFQVLNHGRNAWSAIERNARVYENARIALDIIARDLQSAVALDENGREIPFYVGGMDAPGGTGLSQAMVAFVSAAPPLNDNVNSRLTEISYTWDEDEYLLMRRMVQDEEDADWDFYGSSNNENNWVTTVGSANFEGVIEGVEELRFLCYNQGGNLIEFSGAEGQTMNRLPSYVAVSITLVDPRAADTDLPDAARDRIKDRSRRTFNKVIYLRAEGL